LTVVNGSADVEMPARQPVFTAVSTKGALPELGWLGSRDQAEKACRHYLEALRWPDGTSCPRCGDRSITDIPRRRQFYCRSCRHFFSLTSGTAFHNSHLPLWKWFLTIDLLLSTDGGVPANELMKVLGGSYKTAWFVEHRIRAAICGARPSGSSSRRKGAAHERTYAATLVGRHHQLGLKYLPVYQAEQDWRGRQRYNQNAFRDTVLALLDAEPLSFDALIASGSLVALREYRARMGTSPTDVADKANIEATKNPA
jgi:transposase-like protein